LPRLPKRLPRPLPRPYLPKPMPEPTEGTAQTSDAALGIYSSLPKPLPRPLPRPRLPKPRPELPNSIAATNSCSETCPDGAVSHPSNWPSDDSERTTAITQDFRVLLGKQECQRQIHAVKFGDGGRSLSFQTSAKGLSANNWSNSGHRVVVQMQSRAKRSSVAGPDLGDRRPCAKRPRQDLALQEGAQKAFFEKGLADWTDQAGWKVSRSDG
jgi:dipeptidyl aminopeptidase/acylaminoacyl peptidase